MCAWLLCGSADNYWGPLVQQKQRRDVTQMRNRALHQTTDAFLDMLKVVRIAQADRGMDGRRAGWREGRRQDRKRYHGVAFTCDFVSLD